MIAGHRETVIRSSIRRLTALAIAAAMLCITALSSYASLVAIEQAFEVRPNQVDLPDRADGRLTLRPCRTCRTVALRVTPDTAWFNSPASRQPVGQRMVLAALSAANNSRTLLYIYYEPQTQRVKRIVLDAPAEVER